MLDLPLGIASGALVLANRRLEQLPVELRDVLLRNGNVHMARLREQTREDGEVAVGTLLARGIERVAVSEVERQVFQAAAAAARQSMVPRLYSQRLLETVEQAAFAGR